MLIITMYYSLHIAVAFLRQKTFKTLFPVASTVKEKLFLATLTLFDAKRLKIKSCSRKTTTVLVLNTPTIWSTIYISYQEDYILHCKFDSKWYNIYDILFIHSAVPPLVTFDMHGRFFKARARKIGDMIRDQVRILYLLFLRSACKTSHEVA